MSEDCPTTREVLDRVGDKRSVLVIVLLRQHTHHFNELSRSIEGISQRMLAVTVRALERDGLVNRTISPTMPIGVDSAGPSRAGRSANLEHFPDRVFTFDEFGPLGIRPTAGSCWAKKGNRPPFGDLRRTHGVTYFHGFYSVGEGRLWGVNRRRKGTWSGGWWPSG